jgi:glycerol-3-phosphate dehydrogenase (NAD(P)+)
MSYDTALVIGAGAFGTSIASVLSNKFKRVLLKVRSEDVYKSIMENKENKVYLPGKKLNDNLEAALTWDELTEKLNNSNVEIIVSGLPTQAIKNYYEENHDFFANFLQKNVPFVNLAKGIDVETLELPSDLLYDAFPDYKDNFLFLSGPSFAAEIIDEQVTLVSVAGRSRSHLVNVSNMMQTDYFKCFATYDVTGLLLGGALKNPLAIAAGIIEGLGYNHNTRAGMITRGIVEMLRFGKVFNARPETFYGLSGMGDLILTTTGDESRNKKFGLLIAKGKTPEEIIKATRTTYEGYKTTKAAYELANQYEIRCRILNGLYQVLYEGRNPSDIIQGMMRLPSKFEE